MSLPISLTILRIFFVPLLVVLLLTKGQNLDLWAVAVFLAAAVTDLLDGYLARKRGQITTLGILLDPIADKLLTSSAFISLVALGFLPAWIAVIIIGREFAVSGLRAIASAEGFVLSASDLGKTKMVLEVFAITAILLEHHYSFTQFHIGTILVWLVMISAVVSAIQYFWDFWGKLDTRVKKRTRTASLEFRPEEKEAEQKVTEQNDVAAH